MTLLHGTRPTPHQAGRPPATHDRSGRPLHGGAPPSPEPDHLPAPPTRPPTGAHRLLPSPPADEDVYQDLARAQRWVQPVGVAATLPILVAVCVFATRSPWLWWLYLTVALTVVSITLWLLTGTAKGRVTRASHERTITSWTPEAHPAVDVYLPVCGEDVEVLDNTFRHVARLDWPGVVEVWVLDDGADPHVADLAERHGFRYRVRPDRGHLKKAGNLRSAYAVTEGDVIAIFDADFCPRPDFLHHLVPYLDDPTVGIVQSPQDFDTDERMGWLQRTAGATQEIFYRWVQPSRDRYGATVCCGTNALYRRSALDTIGGFPEIDHSEDMYTGIGLLRTGFVTRFVPVRLARGLCPDELGPFLTQQYRWANGSVALVADGPKARAGLDRRQRLAVWAGFVYYSETALFALNLYVPSVVMCFWYPEQVSPTSLLVFLPSLWVLLVLYPVVHRTRWRPEVLRVQLAQSFSHLVVLGHAVVGHHAGWVPTGGKGSSSALARTIARVMVATLAAGTVAWAVGISRGVASYGVDRYWSMILLAGFYAYVSVPLVVAGLQVLAPRRAAVAPTGTEPTGGVVTAAPEVRA
ncbi:glycosyltransferase family 2 protein [Oerskovia sp. NPDC056781]|uniref:glycosyltransferase family 2 protein n=1 Tax=Oerskovia sp. NPDC056781 TaxID=3345942 RepID=UPI0036709D1F